MFRKKKKTNPSPTPWSVDAYRNAEGKIIELIISDARKAILIKYTYPSGTDEANAHFIVNTVNDAYAAHTVEFTVHSGGGGKHK